MTQEEFWDLLKRFVQFHPITEGQPCLRLDTWAVLKNLESDLNTDSLGMTILDKDKPHFYSRQWAAARFNPNAIRHRFPALLANVSDVLTVRENGKRTDYLTFDLAVLDVIRKPKGPGTRCDRRNEIEIFRDCNDLLNQVFLYLRKVIVAQAAPAGGGSVSFIGSKQEADSYLDSETWLSYVMDEKETAQIQGRMKDLTHKVNVFPWRGGSSNLHGVFASEMRLAFPVCETEVELSFNTALEAISERENY